MNTQHTDMKTSVLPFGLSMVVVALLVCLGCSPQEDLSDLQLQLTATAKETQSNQIALAECQSTLDEWEADVSQSEVRLQTLQNGVSELLAARPELAALTVTVSPNPVICGADEESKWRWSVSVTANRCGVFLKLMSRRTYLNGALLQDRIYDESHVAQYSHLEENYLPLHGTCRFQFGLNCQGIDEIGMVFTGVDDNGNIIETEEVKVALVQ